MSRSFWADHWKSVGWGILILLVCALPADGVEPVGLLAIPHLDKVAHALLYFIFTLLLLSGGRRARRSRALIGAAAIALAHGVGVELLQHHLFTSRTGELWDMAANTAGTLLALLAHRPANRITHGNV